MQLVLGTQFPAIRTFSELKQNHLLTGNRGNMIHAEAPAKLFEHDVARSVYGNISTLQRVLGDAFADKIEENFDLVIISMANFIRNDHDGKALLTSLKALDGRVKIIVLGAGIQGNPHPEKMIPSNLQLIDFFNSRADIFAVRGQETAKWLKKHGFNNAKIIGCPSLYVYPESILGMNYAAARNRASGAKILTAGYLKQMDKGLHLRGDELIKAFKGLRASYVFQDEIFGLPEFQNRKGAFHEGRCEVSRDLVEEWLKTLGIVDVPFDRYHYFTETGSWRQAAMAHDVFVGDRFHGGVVALQACKPAMFLCHDNRVSELTRFFNLPALSTAEFTHLGLCRAMETYLSDDAEAKLKERYVSLYNRFRALFAEHGLKVRPLPERFRSYDESKAVAENALADAPGWVKGKEDSPGGENLAGLKSDLVNRLRGIIGR